MSFSLVNKHKTPTDGECDDQASYPSIQPVLKVQSPILRHRCRCKHGYVSCLYSYLPVNESWTVSIRVKKGAMKARTERKEKPRQDMNNVLASLTSRWIIQGKK